MNRESVFIECVNLGFEVCLFSLFYKLYKSKEACLKSLKEAQIFEINSELLEKVKSIGGVVPYAVVSGNVKALSSLLRSRCILSVRGVIRENLIIRMWNTLQFSVSYVPFAVCSRASGLLKKQICVEIVDPLMAEELMLPTIYDIDINPVIAENVILANIYDFIMNFQYNFAEAIPTIHDFIRNFQNNFVEAIPTIHDFIKNFHYNFVEAIPTIWDFIVKFINPYVEVVVILFDFLCKRRFDMKENMLMEGSALTAVGKLIIDNDKVKIIPPDPGLNYFVTPLTLDSLIKKVSDSVRFHKIICIIAGAVSLCLFISTAERAFTKIKRQINQAKHLKEIEEARRLRLMADSTRKLQARYNNCSRCVVCNENPVEILITECGHACLCLNCSQEIQNICPICRSKIVSSVRVILP